MRRIKKLHVRMLKESDQQHTRDEPADMSKKRDAAAFRPETHSAAEHLH